MELDSTLLMQSNLRCVQHEALQRHRRPRLKRLKQARAVGTTVHSNQIYLSPEATTNLESPVPIACGEPPSFLLVCFGVDLRHPNAPGCLVGSREQH